MSKKIFGSNDRLSLPPSDKSEGILEAKLEELK